MTTPEIIKPGDAETPTLTKACPYLPAIPIMSKLHQGKIDGLAPTPCIGNDCAVFDSCQGEFSPKALDAKSHARAIKHRETVAKALMSCESLPMVGLPLKSLGEKLMGLDF